MPRIKKDAEPSNLEDIFDPSMIDRSLPIGPQIYDVARMKIVLSEVEPGARFNEHDLSRALGVSRTPLREAYQRLASEHLIISRPQVGSIVAPIDDHRIIEGIKVRRALEREVVMTLCEMKPDFSEMALILAHQQITVEQKDVVTYFKIDEEFHRKLAEMAEIPSAWRLVLSVKSHADRARLALMKKDTSRLKRAYDQHIKLMEACSNGDFETAERLINNHVDAIRDAVNH